MRPVTADELQNLLRCPDETCISLYMPVERQDKAKNHIRYKHLLGRAEELLKGDVPEAEARALMQPLRDLAEDDLWRHPEDGLAVFRSKSTFVTYRLPITVPELAVVSHSFHCKPLVGFLHANRKFFLLALSRNHVTLYQGTPHTLVPIDLSGLPHSLREALGVEVKIPHLGSHSGGRGMIFHGAGAAAMDKRDEVVRYFRAIDKALWSYLRNERAPLVLAGIGHYHPIYREVSRYPYLLEHGVEGNLDRAAPAEIHEKAWPLVAEALRRQEDEVIGLYQELAAKHRASDDLGEIGRAAVLGRVRHLLLQRGKQIWGVLHTDSGQIDVHETQGDHYDADVLNSLTEVVLGCDGTVLVLDKERMPTSSLLAAIFRY